jgi:hypothetical protein
MREGRYNPQARHRLMCGPESGSTTIHPATHE